MKTYRFADSKVYEPQSPESLELQRKLREALPDLADGTCFRAGHLAGSEGRPGAVCPYIEGSARHAEWMRGWREGRG